MPRGRQLPFASVCGPVDRLSALWLVAPHRRQLWTSLVLRHRSPLPTTGGQSRLDKVWHAEIANVIPITGSWRLTQQFDYDQVKSNERASDYHNYTASLLDTWQF